VSTPYLARGYYGDEAATTQRFLRRADGECEYDTGDLASLDADGQLRIYGRQDHVVKIRMQRIDLVEVDAALQSLPAVTSAASYVRDAGSAREQLAALVTLNAGATLDMQTMRGALARTLPPYMIPADVRVASRLPQTRTHKLDRPAVASIADSLPKLPLDALGATNLRDDIERELAAIWSDALAAPITDRYVELCGPHVAPEAMHVVLHRTRTQMAVILTIDDVQTHPTLAELAVIVRERGRDAKHASPMRCVVPLSSGPAGQAAYIAPAAGSGASRHRALADALAPRRSVFGLQPLGFDEGEQPHETFAAMTAQYAEEISRATPHGSLVLIGECYGSYVVLDVARRLQAVGREIRLLVLLDPPVRLVRRRSRAAVDLVDLWGECAGFIRCRQWSSLWAVLKLQVVRRTITPLSCVRRRADRVFTAQSDALHWHGPEPYGGRVLHIASEVGARDPRARDFWKSLCVGRYEHTVLAGTNHHDIGNGDHATRVARIIEEGLNHEP
jgi:thioesterase domain-containing protein